MINHFGSPKRDPQLSRARAATHRNRCLYQPTCLHCPTPVERTERFSGLEANTSEQEAMPRS